MKDKIIYIIPCQICGKVVERDSIEQYICPTCQHKSKSNDNHKKSWFDSICRNHGT